ncbi:MAG: FAD-dependent oxidoreductase [Sandaracinaceae bacterium]
MTQSVAIVGSGPAGFYCAEAICKKAEHVQVDIIDRLPTPYGLVRSGVAPDHAGTKNVWRVFQRTARREQVRFLGNVELGRDVSVDELLERYDAVVLACGVTDDRPLGIEGAELPGVYGSRAFTAWYNGHPDFADRPPELRGPGIAVIGNGNVAVDVVRVLGREGEEMAKTDIPPDAMKVIEAADFTEIYMLGRRGPVQSSFTTAELRELGAMTTTVALVDAAQLPETVAMDDPKQKKMKEKIVGTLRGYTENQPDDKPKRLHMRWYASPIRILGDERVEGLECAVTALDENGRPQPTGETFVLEVGTIISAIGYVAPELEGVERSEWKTSYRNDEGKIRDGLWAVGWAKRGPSGVIATNRKDSTAVADKLLEELGSGKPGGAAMDALLGERGVRVVSFEDWERIDAAEVEGAEPASRRKITRIADMIAVLDG